MATEPPTPPPAEPTIGSEASPTISCAQPECKATFKNHRWGRTKASDWFVSRDEQTAWCPEHLPDWVEPWRARAAARRASGGGA